MKNPLTFPKIENNKLVLKATHEVLMKSMDAINRAIGKTTLKLASQDVGRTWKMKQEKLSPRYTTRLSEVIEVM